MSWHHHTQQSVRPILPRIQAPQAGLEIFEVRRSSSEKLGAVVELVLARKSGRYSPPDRFDFSYTFIFAISLNWRAAVTSQPADYSNIGH